MAELKKTPLIRLAKRDGMNPKLVWIIRVSSILFALVLGCIPILITKNNPIAAYGLIIKGALGKPYYMQQTVKIMIPLLGTALAIAPCFKMRFWNIGAEGQITIGAMACTFVAIHFTGKMPSALLLIFMIIAAALVGGLWAFLPGFFKARYNTNETLFTLMMNYIAIGIVAWLQGGPWEGRKGTQMIYLFDDVVHPLAPDALLPLFPKFKSFKLDIGWIIILVILVFIHIYMNYTKHGYEIAVIGDSENTARYAGMNVGWIMERTMLLSGAICGIVGFILVAGQNHTLTSNVANGAGFTAITVTWLAQLNAFAMIVISGILAILSKGSNFLQQNMGVPAAISEIVSGILLFCMLGCEFFINFKMIIRKKSDKEVKA